MKNTFFLSILFFFLYLPVYSQSTSEIKIVTQPDSVVIANGTKISYAEFQKLCNKAWDNSFGKMSDEDKKLFEGTKIDVVVPKTPNTEKLEETITPLILI